MSPGGNFRGNFLPILSNWLHFARCWLNSQLFWQMESSAVCVWGVFLWYQSTNFQFPWSFKCPDLLSSPLNDTSLKVIWRSAEEQKVVSLSDITNLKMQSFLSTGREHPADVAGVTRVIEFLICGRVMSPGTRFTYCHVFQFQPRVLAESWQQRWTRLEV